MPLQRSDEEMRRIMGRQLAEMHRIDREIRELRDFQVTHKIITDPIQIHDAMSEEVNKP